MREKKPALLVTFRTTAGAMAMERACQNAQIPGRLIPVPGSLRAGCGMCWMAPPELRGRIEELVIRRALDVDGLYERSI